MPADIVIPYRNEPEFMKMAITLGYDSIIFCYTQKPEPFPTPPLGLTVYRASLNKPASFANLVLFKAIYNSRGLLERKEIDAIFGLETTSPKDFMHQRASGLNHVLANIAHSKNKKIVFDFSQILHANPEQRALIMGRMSQNIKLCKKSHTIMTIASMARTPYQMRSPHDLHALFCVLGMHPSEAKEALNNPLCSKIQKSQEHHTP